MDLVPAVGRMGSGAMVNDPNVKVDGWSGGRRSQTPESKGAKNAGQKKKGREWKSETPFLALSLLLSLFWLFPHRVPVPTATVWLLQETLGIVTVLFFPQLVSGRREQGGVISHPPKPPASSHGGIGSPPRPELTLGAADWAVRLFAINPKPVLPAQR